MQVGIVQALAAASLAFSGYVALSQASAKDAAEASKAYIVSEIDPRDEAKYTAYLRTVFPLIQKQGGRVIVNPMQEKRVIEGRAIEGRLAVIEFPSKEARDAFWYSPEYEAAKPLRTQNATSRIIHVDGSAPGLISTSN